MVHLRMMRKCSFIGRMSRESRPREGPVNPFRKKIMKSNAKMMARMAPDGGTAILTLTGTVGHWGFSSEYWDEMEAYCQEQKASKLVLRINSPGGYLLDGMAIVDKIKASGLEVEAEVFGMCGSAATLVALACGRVRMSRNSRWMVHHPTGVLAGELEDLENGLADFKAMRLQAFEMYAEKTGKSVEELMEAHAHGVFYTAEQARAYGWVDEIIGEEDGEETPEPAPEEPAADDSADDGEEEGAELSAARGNIGAAAFARLASVFGFRPRRKVVSEDSRLARMQASIDELKAQMTALRAERDGAAAVAAKAEAEAAAVEAQVQERVAKAVAAARAEMGVPAGELPAAVDPNAAPRVNLASMSREQLLELAMKGQKM